MVRDGQLKINISLTMQNLKLIGEGRAVQETWFLAGTSLKFCNMIQQIKKNDNKK